MRLNGPWSALDALEEILSTPQARGHAALAVWHLRTDWPVESAQDALTGRRLHRVQAWFAAHPMPQTHTPVLAFPLTPAEPWPVLPSQGLDAREVFVGALVAHGDDPWAPDASGRILWDEAIQHGLRQVLDQLWRHPARPAPEALWARTYRLRVRTGSALHVAVEQGHVALAQQLLEYGHPPDARDDRKQSVLSALRVPQDLVHWEALGLVPQDAEGIQALKEEWANDKAIKVKGMPGFQRGVDRHAATQALDALRPQLASAVSDAMDVVLKRLLDQPFREEYTPVWKGDAWKVLADHPKEAARHRLRYDKKNPWQGQWSVITALALREFKDTRTPFAMGGLEDWAEAVGRYPPEDRPLLLSGEIRPGFPVRGWLRLLCTAQPGKTYQDHRAGIDWLTEGQDPLAAEIELVREAIAVTAALSPTPASAKAPHAHSLWRSWDTLVKGWVMHDEAHADAPWLPSIMLALSQEWLEAFEHTHHVWGEELPHRLVQAHHRDRTHHPAEWVNWLQTGVPRLDRYGDLRSPYAYFRRSAAYGHWLDWAETHAEAPLWAMRWTSEEDVAAMRKAYPDLWQSPHFPIPKGEPKAYWWNQAQHQRARYEALVLRRGLESADVRPPTAPPAKVRL